jgi:hypothetical protein
VPAHHRALEAPPVAVAVQQQQRQRLGQAQPGQLGRGRGGDQRVAVGDGAAIIWSRRV